MATNQTVKLVIEGENKTAGVFDDISEKLKRVEKDFQPAIKASQAFAGALLGLGAGAVAFGVMTVKSASDAQKEMAKFDAVMQTMEKTAKKTAGGIEGLKKQFIDASKASVQLGFDDEDTANSLALLYQKTGDVNLALRLNQMAMDLSRLKNIDLTMASSTLSRVLVGNARALTDLGISIKDGATPMEMLAEAEKKLTGQSQAFADTFAGKMLALRMVLKNLSEDIGNKLLPTLTEFLNKVLQFAQNVLPVWIEQSKVVIQWIKDHREAVIILASAITAMLIPAVLVFIGHIVAMGIALAPFAIGGAVIAGLVLGILWLRDNWVMVCGMIAGAWQAVVDRINQVPWLKAIFDELTASIRLIWQVIIEALLPVFQQFWLVISTQLWPALQALWIALQPLAPYFEFMAKVIGTLLVVAIMALIAGITASIIVVAKFLQILTEIATFMVGVATKAVEVLTGGITNFINQIKSAVDWVNNLISAIGKMDLAKSAGNALTNIGQKASSIGSSIVQGAVGFMNVPKLAEGGIVNRPTLAMIGESGAEAVIPLRRAGGVAGGLTINITGNSFVGREGIAEKIGNDLMRILKRNVQL